MGGDVTPITARELVERHLDQLFRYAVRLTGSTNDAEDLVQDAFLIAAEKVGQLRNPDCAFAWLVKILRGCRSRDLSRRLPAATIDVEELIAVEPGQPAPFDDVDPLRLQSALDALPDDYRDPLLLFYFEELRYRDIADILGVPLGTVMSRIARAKAILRERLSAAQAKDPPRAPLAIARRTPIVVRG